LSVLALGVHPLATPMRPLVLMRLALTQLMLPVAMLPVWSQFLTCTMLNWTRLWDGPKVSNFGNSQQRASDFLSSVNTTEVSAEGISLRAE